jgi:UDP-glucose 4-epimerase
MLDWIQRQKICVTGGGGALGQRLVAALHKQDAKEVIVFGPQIDITPTENCLNIKYIAGSILNPNDLESAFSGCTLVFHLAALTHAGSSDITPTSYWDINCLGTLRVLEACRKFSIPRVVYTSTGHVYGIPNSLPVTEDHPTRPISNYAASKLAGEEVIQGYAASYGLSGIIARLSNLYGYGLGEDTVIGLALNHAAKGTSLKVRNLEAVRDFTYLDDAAEALIRIAAIETNPNESCILNVSNGVGVSVAQIVSTITKVAESQGLKRLHVNSMHDSAAEKIPSFFLNNTLLQKMTGWVPSIALESGLALTLQEYCSREIN